MFSMALRGSIVSHEELGGPLPMMCFEEQGWIAGSAGKFETLTAEFVSGAQIAGNHVVRGFTAKRDEQLVFVAQFLAKHAGLGKGLEDVRRGKALGCHHGHAQCSLEMNLLPQAALGYPARMQPVQVPCLSGQSPRDWPIVSGLAVRPSANRSTACSARPAAV